MQTCHYFRGAILRQVPTSFFISSFIFFHLSFFSFIISSVPIPLIKNLLQLKHFFNLTENRPSRQKKSFLLSKVQRFDSWTLFRTLLTMVCYLIKHGMRKWFRNIAYRPFLQKLWLLNVVNNLYWEFLFMLFYRLSWVIKCRGRGRWFLRGHTPPMYLRWDIWVLLCAITKFYHLFISLLITHNTYWNSKNKRLK